MNKDKILITLIYKKIDGELTRKEEQIFQSWLDENSDHIRYFERIKVYCERVGRGEVKEVEVNEAWMKLIKKVRMEKKVRMRQRVYRWAGIAASVAVFVVAWYVWKNDFGQDTVSLTDYQNSKTGQQCTLLELADGKVYELGKDHRIEDTIAGRIIVDGCRLNYVRKDSVGAAIEYNKLSVPRGGVYQLKLEDGSRVWLNSDTRLRFPVAFGGNVREVFLEGEAYFEVEKDSQRPFIVHAGEQVVRVLGTGFGITCYPDEKEQSVTLVEGKVEVVFPRYVKETYVMVPGNQVLYDKIQHVASCREVNVREFVAWKDGNYVFDKKRLEDILNTLSRWYDFRVFYQNSSSKDILFSGEIQRFEDFNTVLSLLEKSSEVQFVVNKNVVRVINKH